MSRNLLALIDTLSSAQDTMRHTPTLFVRAVVYADVQNYPDALRDVDQCLRIDSTSALLWWHRAYCSVQHAASASSMEPINKLPLLLRQPMEDIKRALSLSPDNPYLHYNLGCMYLQQDMTADALQEFTTALQMNDVIAEAYYNRAICYQREEKKAEALADLSKAGQLGLHQAYSMMKKIK